MPFDAFKARVRIVKDEVVVKKWVEDQEREDGNSSASTCPEAGMRLWQPRRGGKAFPRGCILPNIIKSVEKHTLTGAAVPAVAFRRDCNGSSAPRGMIRSVFRFRSPRSSASSLRRTACNSSRSTRRSRTSRWRARISSIWTPRPFPRWSSRSSSSSTPTPEMHPADARVVEALAAQSPPGRCGSQLQCPAPAAPRPGPWQLAQRPRPHRPLPQRNRRKLNPRRNRLQSSAICIGSFIRATSLNLPTAFWKRPRNPSSNRPRHPGRPHRCLTPRRLPLRLLPRRQKLHRPVRSVSRWQRTIIRLKNAVPQPEPQLRTRRSGPIR